MFEEINLNNIKSDLKRKYDLSVIVEENKLYCDEFNGYIKNDDTYLKIQDLAESICCWLQYRYGCFANYSILDSSELVIEVF